MRIATAETWYETTPLEDGVTHIHEPFIKAFYRCNIWHVRGRDRDLLVDSGMGVTPTSITSVAITSSLSAWFTATRPP
jgi:hypothetical protein